MYKFKLKVGNHQEADGQGYTEGDVFTSPHPLDQLFGKNKFERLEEIKPEPEVQLKPSKIAEETKENQQEPDGKEVTDDFPVALENDYRVYKKSRWHYVYALDNLNVQLNEKALTEAKVNEFIQELEQEE